MKWEENVLDQYHQKLSFKMLFCWPHNFVCSLSNVQLFEIPWTVAHPVTLLHGILEWIAISYSSGPSWPRDWTRISNNSWASSCLFLLSVSYFLPLPFVKALNGKESMREIRLTSWGKTFQVSCLECLELKLLVEKEIISLMKIFRSNNREHINSLQPHQVGTIWLLFHRLGT